ALKLLAPLTPSPCCNDIARRLGRIMHFFPLEDCECPGGSNRLQLCEQLRANIVSSVQSFQSSKFVTRGLIIFGVPRVLPSKQHRSRITLWKTGQICTLRLQRS